jgi:excisionase family DNA binding protein
MPFEKRFLKISEVCEYLSISLSKCHRDIASKRLPAVRIGTSIRVDKRALDEQLEKQKAGPGRAL